MKFYYIELWRTTSGNATIATYTRRILLLLPVDFFYWPRPADDQKIILHTEEKSRGEENRFRQFVLSVLRVIIETDQMQPIRKEFRR